MTVVDKAFSKTLVRFTIVFQAASRSLLIQDRNCERENGHWQFGQDNNRTGETRRHTCRRSPTGLGPYAGLYFTT